MVIIEGRNETLNREKCGQTHLGINEASASRNLIVIQLYFGLKFQLNKNDDVILVPSLPPGEEVCAF